MLGHNGAPLPKVVFTGYVQPENCLYHKIQNVIVDGMGYGIVGAWKTTPTSGKNEKWFFNPIFLKDMDGIFARTKQELRQKIAEAFYWRL